MERYESLFAQLKERKEGAFVPFVTLGDPGIEQSLKIIDTLIEAGADALELGIPFSDPLADGPTIQNATLRAFAAGVTPAQCFEMLALIRQKTSDHSCWPADVRQRCLTKALMSFTPSARKSASIRCWLPMCQLKSPRPSAGPRCVIMSHLSLFARRMPTMICCAR